MDKDPEGPYQKPKEDAKECETEKITLVWTCQKKRRRKPLKKNDGHGCTGEEKKGRSRRRWLPNIREDAKNTN